MQLNTETDETKIKDWEKKLAQVTSKLREKDSNTPSTHAFFLTCTAWLLANQHNLSRFLRWFYTIHAAAESIFEFCCFLHGLQTQSKSTRRLGSPIRPGAFAHPPRYCTVWKYSP